ARTLKPEVAEMRLEADAAAARVGAESSPPDSKFNPTYMDVPRDRPSYAPTPNAKTTKYTINQELPFFGKRDLKENIAGALAHAADAAAQSTVNEVLARVKVAYAQYYQAHLAMEQTASLIEAMTKVAKIAQVRYGQGVGDQQEAARAELERSSMVAELARLETNRSKARARLNALVNHPANAPLVEAPRPRTLPSPAALDYARQGAHPESSFCRSGCPD
ncbi:MAG: TolC family protein, partial [Alphaproteobacteria bacterium]|nr:TolC family protein [Alphaproteobacteria bacterium]